MSLPVPVPESSKQKHSRYPEYKDSGIEWLGAIPSYWIAKKIKFLAANKANAIKTGPFGSQLLNSEMNGGDIKVYNQKNVFERDFRLGENRITKEKYATLSSFTVFSGDILITTRGTIGRCAIVPQNAQLGILHPCLMRFQPDERLIFPAFLEKIIQDSTLFNSQLAYNSNATTIDVVYSETFKNIKLPIPSVNEQQIIVNYLDQETEKIDQLIEKKKRLIELLEEQRTVIITHAVTKGLNPDVEIKDSGVEWLGEIPEHWDLKTVKRIFKVFNGSTPKSSEPSFWDGEIPWVTPEDLGELTTNEIDKTKRNITKAGYASCGTIMVPVGSIVLSTRAPIGHLAIAKIELCTNQGCRSLVPNANVNHNYGFYVLYSARQELVSFGQGSTFMELGKSKLEAVSLPLPPINEQQAIADYLDKETTRIDNLINKINQAIEKLQEYRSALITAAVTGKIDVRQHVS